MTALSSSSSSAPNATVTPVPNSCDTPVIDAWNEALEKYKKSLPKKDQELVQMSTGPADVVKEIEDWHLKLKKKKSTKVAAAVSGGLARLQRFTDSIDMLAQGSPAPGCLLWGSIKFTLTIVQHAVHEYERLCEALTQMIECLPRVELYSKTFMNSSLLCGCVSAFYVSVLRFWSRACKFYRRGRFWNFLGIGWKDYDAEFQELEVEMVANRDRIEKTALAEHIGQSKVARNHQEAVNQTLLEVQSSDRRKEITEWLSPSAYDIKYYQKDFEAARKMRHPKTCEWILKKAEFTQFSATNLSQEPLLWIHAKPGAGKTVLSSYLIEYYRQQGSTHMSNAVLYFFCKNSDEDKNLDIAIMRSLLYQMSQCIENLADQSALSNDLGRAIDESGKQRAMDYATLWLLFTKHISKLTQPVMIVDALDECSEPKLLIQNLMALSQSSGIRVILTSRKEAYISKMLADKPCLEIRPEDVDADIKALIEAKVSKQPLLCHRLVRDLVVKSLSEAHAGMFLWVYLMLKELKACRSVEQVEETLRTLPEGLPMIYKSILLRLCTSLKRPALDLAKKVFVWVVSASRPLRIEEISDALTFQYKVEGHTLLTGDQIFPCADKDMEQVCGSLLTVRDGTVQVIHLTVKEFLRDKEACTDPADPCTQLMVDPISASLQLSLVSLKYISQHLTEPIVDLHARGSFSDMFDEVCEICKIAQKMKNRLKQSPFLKYASLNWPTHFIDCEGVSGSKVAEIVEIVEAFRSTFDSKATFLWIEMCLSLDRSSFERICPGLEDILDWADNAMQYAPRSIKECTFLKNWCTTIPRVIDDMGFAPLSKGIYLLDFSETFRSNGLGETYNNHGNFVAREIKTLFRDDQSHLRVQTNTSPLNRLQLKALPGGIGLFIYDYTRRVFITADASISHKEVLYIQDFETGRRLPPVTDPELVGIPARIRVFKMSKDGKYLSIVYELSNYYNPSLFSLMTSIWQIDSPLDFRKRMRSGSWARKIFSKKFSREVCVDASVVYGDDGYIYSPAGRIHLDTGTVVPFPHTLLSGSRQSVDGLFSQKDTFNSIYHQFSPTHHFSTGGYCFVQESEDRPVIRYSIQEPESRDEYLIPGTLLKAGPTGRYLLLSHHLRVSRVEVSLYDITSKESFTVPQIEIEIIPNSSRFEFSEDESRLFCFTSCSSGLHTSLEILVMDLGGGTPKIRSYGKCNRWINRGFMLSPAHLFICDDDERAWLATDERDVYPVDLSTREITFPKGIVVTQESQDFPKHCFKISRDGMSLSILHYGTSKAYIQMFNLNKPEQPPRRIDLAWTQLKGNYHLMKFSQDASILVCGADLYHLPNEYQSPIPITIEPILVASRPEDFEFNRDDQVWVSHHKGSVAYVSWYLIDTGLSLYRVNLDIRSSLQMGIPPFRRGNHHRSRHNFGFDFHPSLPLALLSYDEPRPPFDKENIVSDVKTLTLNLNNLNIKPVEIHQSIQNKFVNSGEQSSFPEFTDCGSHINFNQFCVGHLQIEPSPTRIKDTKGFTYKDECYYPVHVEGREYISLGFSKTRLPILSEDNQGIGMAEVCEALTSCQTYPGYVSNTILLGSTDHDLMRIVFISEGRLLEIRTLLWTFAELRSQLLRKSENWELEPGKASSDRMVVPAKDMPITSSSENLSPSDLITWSPGFKESTSESE